MPDPDDLNNNPAPPGPAEGALGAPAEPVEGAGTPAPLPTPAPAAAPAPQAPQGGDVPSDEGVEALRRQLHAERTQREALQQQLREETGRRSGAEQHAHNSQLSALKAQLEAVGRDGDMAEAEYAKALAAGDHVTAARAQRLIAKIEARTTQIEQAVAYVEQQAQRPPAEGRQGAETAYADPVEKLASQLDARSAQWLRSHPECATDPVRNAEMIAAHHIAVRSGHQPGSDSYFAAIDQRMGFAAPSASPAPQRQGAPAAPAASTTPTASRPSPGTQTIVLSAEQRQMARDLGMTEKEYATELAAIQQSGGQAMH